MEQLLNDLYEINALLDYAIHEQADSRYKNTIKRLRKLQRETKLLINEMEHILNPDSRPRWNIEEDNENTN